jgi:hypothetical protein
MPLNENTILVVSPLGPYTAIGFHANSKAEIEQTLNPFYNHGAFDGEVQFKSDVFGYITGPKEKAYGGILAHFTLRGIQAGRKTRTRGAELLAEAKRQADKVWAARVHEPFMQDLTTQTIKKYAEPTFAAANS